ncbi:hypothetical protein E2562_005832 [Oryza meyeriana var. granulata]|uniref:Bifunctional inhibitor/plant lipid transfer protein/seed storage helical domain-containing protein n=1 Tax=Oryza meyeriana var. granulata TaxID=110450 RepID=A0A6G1CDY6_9ORYZ|nr:hypothetical protein E2562_005832 [Oryza meyeriana var. granulata]
MKIVFIVALLAIVASSASAQFDTCSQGYGQCQLQQLILNPCIEFVRQQCSMVTIPFLQSPMWQLRSCQVMQQQCCQQLRLMAQQSRWLPVSTVVQAIMHQLQLQQFGGFYFDQTQAQAQSLLALNLPSMRGIYPNYYNTRCNIATVGGVWY